MKKQRQAYILAFAACFMWSTMATAFTLALREMGGVQVMLGASLVAVVLIFLYLALARQLFQFGLMRRRYILKSALLGLLNPFIYYVVVMKAYAVLPAQEAMALNYTWPVILVLFSVPVLGQHIGWRSVMALIISFCGVLVIGSQGHLSRVRLTNPSGDFLAVGSAVIWALYWVYNVKFSSKPSKNNAIAGESELRSEPGDIVRFAVSLGFGSIYLLIIAVMFAEIKMPSWQGWLSIIYIGMFELGITFIVWLKALKLSSSTDKVSQFIFISPFLALVWIRMILGEDIHPATIIGLGFVIGGVVLQHRFAAKRYVS